MYRDSSPLSRSPYLLFFLFGSLVCLLGSAVPVWALTPTTTSLTVSSSSVVKGSAVTLTAEVNFSSAPVTTGVVDFYQVIGNSKLLLSSQSLTAGASTAVLKYSFGVGSWTVEADFQATSSFASSTSPRRTITVTGTNDTKTVITSSGSVGSYTLTGTVNTFGAQQPTGDISFEDASNSNSVLALQSLDTTTAVHTFIENQSCSTQNCPVGSNPYSIQSADLNGDGILDLVVGANYGLVKIYLGAGDGSFTFLTSYNTGSALYFAAIGDVNRDGIPDLALAIYGSNQVGVMLGDGSGHFGSITTYNVGNAPAFVAIGDFNMDGITDLVVANYQSGSVGVLLGNGDGTFQSMVAMNGVGQGPYAIAVDDLNHDGKMDIAVADIWIGGVRVLLGNGDGAFQSFTTYSSGGAVLSGVVTGDFNEDGAPDIAAVGSSVLVFLNNGSGSFSSGISYSAGSTPYGITVGDFNSDGHLDLAVVNANSNNLTVLLGKGDGTFAALNSFPTQQAPVAITQGDFNRDGSPDLALVTSFGPLEVYLGAQTASATVTNLAVPGASGTHNVLASYAGDTHNSASSSTTIALSGATATTLSLSSAAINATYGDTVTVTGTLSPSIASVSASDFQLVVDSAAVPASISYANGTVIATYSQLAAGAHTAALSFGGTAQYHSSVSNQVNLTIAKAAPAITWNSPAAITYGTALSSMQLNASASVNGSLAYTPSSGTVLSAGTQPLTATFTPTDTANYRTIVSTVQLTVNRATPAVTWSAPAAIIYGTALSGAQLNASAAVNGSFAYTPTAGVILPAGTQTLTATFTPTDTTNYQTTTNTVQLTVDKATPTISWSTPAAIVYGTALSAMQLNASSSVAGTFTYSPAFGAVLAAGQYPLTASFAPVDASNYTPAVASTSLVVNKAASTISLVSNAASTTVGQAVTLTSTVQPAAGSSPTGTVSFFDGSVLLGAAALSNGQASYTVGSLTTGSHVFSAAYSGDSNFLGASTTGTVPVAVGSQDFTVTTGASGTQTVMPGAQAAYSFSIAPLSGTFTSPLTFVLSGLPPGATYTLSPSSFAAGTSGGSVVLTIQTAKSTTMAAILSHSGIALAAVLLPLLPWRRKGKKRGTLLLLVFASLAVVGGLSGCGASGTFAQASKDYTVTLVAVSGTPTHTTTFTLNVQ